MTNLIAWFKSKGWTAHAVFAACIAAAGIIGADTQVQQFLAGLFANHPAIAAQIIALAVIIAKYTHSSSAAGTLANARNIQASPDAPTASQVDAATTK